MLLQTTKYIYDNNKTNQYIACCPAAAAASEGINRLGKLTGGLRDIAESGLGNRNLSTTIYSIVLISRENLKCERRKSGVSSSLLRLLRFYIRVLVCVCVSRI